MHGHVHAYERTYPVNNYAVDQCGMRWITIGDGGNIEGLYKTFASQNGTCFCTPVNNATFSNGCPCAERDCPTRVPQVRAPLPIEGLLCPCCFRAVHADRCQLCCTPDAGA